MNRTIFIAVLIGLFFFGCKKYPEGPAFTLRTKKHRVSEFGMLDKYVVNGIDSTAYLSGKFVVQSTGDTSEFDIRLCGFLKEKTAGGYLVQTEIMNGNWDFNEDKTSLLIQMSTYSGVQFKNIFINGGEHEWKIMKLTMKEMHLKTTFNNNTYELYFLPK